MMNKRRFTMYTKQPKKMIIINILDILKRYTDENHRLSQREIMDILEREYDMKVDRKAVKRNLMNLIDFGYQVEYSESIRQGKNRIYRNGKHGICDSERIIKRIRERRDYIYGLVSGKRFYGFRTSVID